MAKSIKQMPSPYPFSVVVGIEFTKASGYALDQAERIARRIPGSQVHAVHVVASDPGEARRRELLSLLRLYVTEKITAIDGTDGQMVGAHIRFGNPDVELAKVAADIHAELILVGTHLPPHLKTVFVRSVAERLMLRAPCSVLVVGQPLHDDAEKREPEIESTCPDCLAQRFDTQGHDWWCVQHGVLHSYRRVHPATSTLPPRSAAAGATRH